MLTKLAVWYLKRQKLTFTVETARGDKGRFVLGQHLAIYANGLNILHLFQTRESK
jgi:hypothetical protein